MSANYEDWLERREQQQPHAPCGLARLGFCPDCEDSSGDEYWTGIQLDWERERRAGVSD